MCLTLDDPIDYTVHGILQARILEWVDFPFSRGSCQPRNQTQVSLIAGRFFTTDPPGKLAIMIIRVFLIAQLVKNLPAMQEIPVLFLGREDLLEKG